MRVHRVPGDPADSKLPALVPQDGAGVYDGSSAEIQDQAVFGQIGRCHALGRVLADFVFAATAAWAARYAHEWLARIGWPMLAVRKRPLKGSQAWLVDAVVVCRLFAGVARRFSRSVAVVR
jgi:hypothetical protein